MRFSLALAPEWGRFRIYPTPKNTKKKKKMGGMDNGIGIVHT